jgi:N4-gp56 family major capsid protein
MAETFHRSDSNLTQEKWMESLFREANKRTYFGKYAGDSEQSIIQNIYDLEGDKEAGDKITIGLLMELTGAGVVNDGKIEGNEEALVYHDYKTQIFCRGNGVVSGGKMSRKRTAYDIRKDARSVLAGWIKNVIDNDTVLSLSGLANPVLVNDDGAVLAAVAPSTNRKFYGGQTTAGVLTEVANDAAITNASSAHLFGTKVIELLKRKAKMASPIIRPVVVEGKEYYVIFIHPWQVKALRADADWKDAQKSANVRGDKNPIFSGALGVWDGVVVHEYERILYRTGAATQSLPSEYFEATDICTSGVTVCRALFCGAQAGVHAWGQKPKWMEDNFDYGRRPGVATDFIYRADKTRFNSEDFGVITCDTAAVPD